MSVRRRHLVHTGVWAAILLLVGFAVAFAVDAVTTNRTYDDLVARHVDVDATVIGCADVGRYFSNRVCRVGYRYGGQEFTAVIPAYASHTILVDPGNPAIHMDRTVLAAGPTPVVGDVSIAAALLVCAVAVFTVHLVHLRSRRRRR